MRNPRVPMSAPQVCVTTQVSPAIPLQRWAFRWTALLLLSLCLLLAAPAQANDDPQALIKQASDQVLNALQMEGTALTQDTARLYALVDGVLANQMDFERMSRWALGKYWKSATAEQQARFVAEFRGLLVRTYATALASYSGQQVIYHPLRATKVDNEVVVRTEIQQPAGPPIAVHYSLYLRNGEWKTYDVLIDGISLVANYRATFSAEVRSSGVEGLINILAARNQQASAAQ